MQKWEYRPNSFMRFDPTDNNQNDIPYPAPGHYGSTTGAMHHYYTMWYKLNQYYRYKVISKGQLIMLFVALLYDAMAFIGKHPWSQRNEMLERIESLDLQHDRTYVILSRSLLYIAEHLHPTTLFSNDSTPQFQIESVSEHLPLSETQQIIKNESMRYCTLFHHRLQGKDVDVMPLMYRQQ